MERSTTVMTGASRGIGLVAAQHLLATDRDLQLVVLGRVPAELAGPRVTAIPADLSSLADVHRAATEVTTLLDAGLPPLRGLIANAGIQHSDARTTTVDGHEATFAVNVIANHLILRVLADRFTTPARVVITTSDTHFGDLKHNLGMVPAPRWRDPEVLAAPGAFPKPDSAPAGRTAYSTSKLATVHQVHELARRLPPGVEVLAHNPGFVPGTGLTRNAGPAVRFTAKHFLPLLARTPIATDVTTAGRHLAESLTRPITSGDYVDRDHVADSAPQSYDRDREARLWAVLDELCGTWVPAR
ncbi:SDR family NAD(P)-dependent oxidoreductase [Actinosynnema pretiosum subsp. pretiosum]|uniref:SDR family NAD(P)-dependent oxidoreductase n=1 Tax=Actinosynnema pretiosum subsp. pretiosum TaxID=103721 RepID=A0AA45R5J3_9PSEU|nr:Sorbitol-6-phosphate 2-dehydrogenase [Actinosynnema pretiosum subsp. pretiosum]QUF06016.1 SDR family NAD(P)-dependent oxidoreductase [Actinosynnema pretiosum subsp. pretiosum]